MINRIKQLFSDNEQSKPGHSQRSLNLACAALMVEVMVIDQQLIAAEKQQIIRNLHQRFELSIEEATELLSMAMDEVDGATSLYQFTKTINQVCSDPQKFQLIKQLWQVAYADEQLDKHEEALIRRIADLIHLPHSQFIRAKQAAKPT